MRVASRSRQLHLIALVFFAGLTFILLYPLIFNNGVKVAGFDYFDYNWNFWWTRHALTTPGLNLYQSDFVMFPFMANYGYHALTLFWYPVWALIEPFAGTLTAVNVIIALACTLNGYLLFVLLRREHVAPGLALLAGALLQSAPILRYFYYNTHLNLMDWFWLPAQLLLWQQIVRAVDAGRLRRALMWAVVQGVALWGLTLTDLQFPIFAAFLLAPYGLLTLWRTRSRPRLIAAGIVVVAVALPLLWFAGPLPYIFRFKGTLVPGTVEDRPGIPIPSGFLTMSQTWWDWSTPSLGALITVIVIATLIVALLRRDRIRDRWLWFWLMLPPLIFALGPTLTIAGSVIPLPYQLLHELTNGMFRMPWRLAPIFIVAALIFAAKTWTPIFRRMGNKRILVIGAALLLLALDVRLFGGGPLDPVPVDYAYYHTIGAETGDPYDGEVVLEVPTAAATGEIILGDQRAVQLQYYGITHQKRMVNGFISRTPLEDFWYMRTDDPMLSWLGQRRYLEPEAVEAQLRQRIFDWPIGYVVVHQNLIGRDTSTDNEVLGYLNSLGDLLCPVAVEGDAVFYRTAWHPDGCPPRTPPETSPGVYTLDVGASGDEAYLGWGWHYAEDIAGVTLRWAGVLPQETPPTRVYVDLPPDAYTVTLSAQAFRETRSVTVAINDTVVAESLAVPVDSLHDFTFEVPASAIGDGQHIQLTLAFDATIAPADVEPSADTRQLAIAVDTIRFARSGSAAR